MENNRIRIIPDFQKTALNNVQFQGIMSQEIPSQKKLMTFLKQKVTCPGEISHRAETCTAPLEATMGQKAYKVAIARLKTKKILNYKNQ